MFSWLDLIWTKIPNSDMKKVNWQCPHLQGFKRKAMQSGYVAYKSASFSRTDGDACLPGLQNPHLWLRLRWVLHQISGTITFFFQAQLFYGPRHPSAVPPVGPHLGQVHLLSFLNYIVHAHDVRRIQCLYIHLMMNKSLSIIPRLSRLGCCWTEVFWSQNKGQFPRNLWESCLLVLAPLILQGKESILKKVQPAQKSDLQDRKRIWKFGAVSCTNLLYNLGQQSNSDTIHSYIKWESWTRWQIRSFPRTDLEILNKALAVWL